MCYYSSRLLQTLILSNELHLTSFFRKQSQFAEAAIHPPLPDDNYPFAQYDSWTYGADITYDNQLAALQVAYAIGLEVTINKASLIRSEVGAHFFMRDSKVTKGVWLSGC